MHSERSPHTATIRKQLTQQTIKKHELSKKDSQQTVNNMSLQNRMYSKPNNLSHQNGIYSNPQ